MPRKTVYFVRHGQSEGNVEEIRQEATASLTEPGRFQAGQLAERFSSIPIELIISSNMRRAEETAKIISLHTSHSISVTPLFAERRRSQLQLGKPKNDATALRIDNEIEANFHIRGYRCIDEENLDDLKLRAQSAFEFLLQRPEKNILVVTHGFFMKIMMGYALLGEELAGEACRRIVRKFHMENTGISVFHYDDEEGWWPWIWNDQAHLGDS